jgi:hypothetical protein
MGFSTLTRGTFHKMLWNIMKRKSPSKTQSARFIEAAKKTGADESGKPFEKAFKKIVKAEKAKKP